MTTLVAQLRVLLAIGAVAALATAAAGCGSDSDEGGSSGDASSAFPEAVKVNEEFEQRPTSIGVKTPVGKPIPKGKEVVFIQCGVPACATEREIFEEAMGPLGWKLKSIDAGTTPEEIKAAYQQAINIKPDAVLGSGFSRVLYEPELQQLKKLGIPVIQSFVQDEPGNGLTAVIAGATTSEYQGKMMANYVLANSDDKEMTVGVISVKGFETVEATAEKVEEIIAAECPTCKTKRLNAPVTSIGNDLPQRISSFLTANPEIKWVTAGYNDVVVGLPTALKGAGVEDVKLVTVNINPSIAPYLKKGEYLQATVGTSFPEVYFRVVDVLTRIFTDQPYEESIDSNTLPYWTITAETLPSTTEEFPVVTDYKEQYFKLWGIE